MSEYEHSIVVEAAPEAVFDFVSNIRNSPVLVPTAYLPEAQRLDPARTPEGWVRIHPGEYLMEWGADGECFYSGWIQIDEMGDDLAEITMHLSLPSRLDLDIAATRQELLAALQTIKQQVETSPRSAQTLLL